MTKCSGAWITCLRDEYDFNFTDFTKQLEWDKYVETPERGVYDKMLTDSDVERQFSLGADRDPEVICFIKLPSWYKIKTPIGEYEPDFGVVLKRKQLKTGIENEYYFVIETKGTNDINDKKPNESDIYKFQCAFKTLPL
jgi:type III restriction enzyme